MRVLFIACLAAWIASACADSGKLCAVPSPSGLALLAPGEIEPGIFKTYAGRILSPVGQLVEVGTMPLNLALSPDGRFAAVTHAGPRDARLQDPTHQSIQIVDLESGRVVRSLQETSLFHGIAFNPNGNELYASTGGSNGVVVYDDRFTRSWNFPLGDFTSGLAVTPDGRTLIVARLNRHRVSFIDTERIEAIGEAETWAYPFDVVITPDGSRAFVSNWGDASVTLIDVANVRTLGRIEVGKNPSGLAVSPDGRFVYVANADSDDLSIIDVAAGGEANRVSLRSAPSDPPGLMPVDVAVSSDGGRLYVTLAGDNSVAVLDSSNGDRLGRIPVGHYPTALAISGNKLVVANMKSGPARPNPNGEFIGAIQWGSLSILNIPADSDLIAQTAQVEKNNNISELYFPIDPTCERLDGPVPLRAGQPSPIRHVVYIVHENKTYDSVLGDLEGARGEPSLVRYGESVTPNLHALARRFVNLDNCTYPGEQALQAHTWITQGWVNDFTEKNGPSMWARPEGGRFFIPGVEAASRPSDRMLYDALDGAGVAFRIYGDPIGVLGDMFGTYRDNFDWRYPTWSLQVREVDKAEEFIRELEAGIFPSFVIVWLPNDVTNGIESGKPSPESMVSDNDLATGRVVEAISWSPFWNETLIVLVNDDTQGQSDHIDAHRGPCVVISPYAKQGYTSHVHYSIPSFHRTMGLILGVEPISRFDQLAPPLYDVFDAVPFNAQPFVAIEPSVAFRRN